MQKETNDRMDLFLEKCRQNNLKITPQRVALYKILMNNTSHPSTKEVYNEVIMEYPNISFDTVNRTLNLFARKGIIDVVEGYKEPRRFDPNRESHHHVHCIQCGRIFDFINMEYDNLGIPEIIEREFRIVGKRVVLNGICRECSDSER